MLTKNEVRNSVKNSLANKEKPSQAEGVMSCPTGNCLIPKQTYRGVRPKYILALRICRDYSQSVSHVSMIDKGWPTHIAC